ncbi:MarR family transcriptional regulator [Bacillus sp. AFS018417]|uniref:MarR family winged helix-turn-helix transcriptional regulator n=1 Tax=unclassified Bacillus (in: firmicutes) TaxID=185979 RepID=UPI000BFA57E0|nr:MarR family transcriptional regulator [Bacillus sp. AFS018417]PEZ03595.1 MarR family transcriptional regulator [Bacillus sp. AFS018417]
MLTLNKHWETIYFYLRHEYEENLTHQAIRILQMISRKEAPTISHIAAELHLSHNTASEHIKRLIQKGFVVKERSKQDERVVIVKLTETGQQALATHTLLDEAKLKQIGEKLSKEEKKLIQSAFELLAKEAHDVFSH